MCGFTVCVRSTGLQPQDLEALRRCNSGMRYRGPDENGVWHDARVAFGHVRLSIIGVSNGKQPIFSADSRFVLVCNGEIYNHHALREQLESLGAQFTTLSDSEVIIHAYRLFGDDFLSRLDGMFAFVLYDREEGRLVAARDAAGKKPLYRHEAGSLVVFSSEHKAIAGQFLPQGAAIDYEVIRQVQRHRFSITDRATYIRQILKVPPGHRVDVAVGRGGMERRWADRKVESLFDGSYEQAVEQTRKLLFQAVEKRLESEVPLALMLSAGIDSSAIASICAAMGRKIQTFSAGYAGAFTTDESIEAERLARQLGMPFERVLLDESRFVDDLGDILPFLDEPNGDPSMFSQWALYRAIRARGFKVLLSGIAGDELFYGYPQMNSQTSERSLRRPGKSARFRALVTTLVRRPVSESVELLDFVVRQAIRNRSLFRRPVLSEVLDQSTADASERMDMPEMVDSSLREELDRTYSSLVRSYLPNNGFFLSDKLAMAHSIEVRCPLADGQLRAFVDRLPMAYKFPRNEAKGLLKDALRGVVPDEVLDRRKTGFTPPSKYVLAGVSRYRNRFFQERVNSLAQAATDYYCATAVLPHDAAQGRRSTLGEPSAAVP
jgi:asparagine synthase (glutamine-hydrolysing)